ncbi:MAG: helix-turn-helix domain-containing protein [Lachnospiraceae bacterium]
MTELGERITALVAQGKTTKEIVDLCGVSGTTARKYRRRYCEKHPDGALTLRNILPKATKKDTELWQQAVTAWEIAQIRAEIRVGDKIPLQSLKIAEMVSGTEPTNGRRTTGIVVSTSNRRFCIVELSNHAKECILWSDLAMRRRVQKEVEGKKA